jgi:hypothetical protein
MRTSTTTTEQEPAHDPAPPSLPRPHHRLRRCPTRGGRHDHRRGLGDLDQRRRRERGRKRLSKTAGTSAWDAGAVSVETLAGDGYVEFAVGAVGDRLAAGLSNGDGGQDFADIDFAIRLGAGGAVQVVEAGTLVGSFGSFAAGDRFRVEAESGVVTYSRSGAPPFYTSAVTPTFPLAVDTAFHTPGAAISDVDLVSTQLTWENAVGVAVSGDSITKTASTTGWNAGAASLQTISGDGFLEFAVADNTTAKAAGLSSGDGDQDYADIDYALQLTGAGVVRVSEGGVVRGSFGTYLAGDRFRVEVAGGVVSYSRNGGAPFYTSAVPASFPLGVDTSLSTPGAAISDLALVEAANACPVYDGTGVVCSGTFTVNNSIDLADIASCANITGNLTIQAPGMSEIALPLLERIGGNLTVTGNTDMTRLRLPALKEIGGRTSIEAPAAARGIDFSRLRTGRRIATLTNGSVVMAFPCLDTSGTLEARKWNGSDLVAAPLHVPRLRQIDGAVSAGIVTAPALTTVSGSVGGSSVSELVTLDAPSLTSIGRTLFYHPEDHLPSLVDVGLSLIAGSLTVCGGPAGSDVLDLPSLERAGALRICSSAFQQVSLPSLQTITGPTLNGSGLYISASGVAGGIELPALSSVEGTILSVDPIDLQALTDVSGDLEAWGPVSAPVLASVGDTLLLRGPTSYLLPSLAFAGSVVCSRGTPTSIDLPALTEVATRVDIRSCNVVTISMPVLASIPRSLTIQANPELMSFDFGALLSLGDSLTIKGNSSLPNCYATDIHDRLVANGWIGTAIIKNNNGTGSCP